MKRLSLLTGFVVILQLIGCASLDTRPSNTALDEIMRKSGLWFQLSQVEPTMQMGISQAQEKMGRLSGEKFERLQKAITATYGADVLRTTVKEKLAATLTSEDVAGILRWLSSDLGKRIMALEEKGSTPDMALNAFEAGPMVLDSLPASRRTRLERIASLTQAAEFAAEMIIDTSIGIAEGLAGGGSNGDRAILDEMKRQIRLQKGELVKKLGPRAVGSMAVIYQSLPDDDLDQYVALCASPLGQRYTAATVGAFSTALSEAAVRLGRQLSEPSAALSESQSNGFSPIVASNSELRLARTPL